MPLLSNRTSITLKNAGEIEKMRRAGALAAQTLAYAISETKAGMTTKELDKKIHQFIIQHKAIPATLNYHGYPASSCLSLNEVICHGIPSKKITLRDGDIIGIDITVILDDYYGDTAATIPVGRISSNAHRLLYATQRALQFGMNQVKDGAHLGDIGSAIQSYIEPLGYSIVRDFVGHGIGRSFHENPQVPHHGKYGTGLKLLNGMTFTIEPMINEGVYYTRVLRDGWGAVTADGKLSAQFEHTILCTKDGSEILTLLPDSKSINPGGYDVEPFQGL